MVYSFGCGLDIYISFHITPVRSGVRICSHLEAQLACHQVDDVLGVRTCSHLEAQLACHQVDDVLGVRVFSHLEVINTNRTTCTEANDSQVCEYDRTWKRNPLVIKGMMF